MRRKDGEDRGDDGVLVDDDGVGGGVVAPEVPELHIARGGRRDHLRLIRSEQK